MLSESTTYISADTLRAANISPATYLATDFLNHYNEVAMLIDLLSMDPEVSEDILEWAPASYTQHFAQSGFRDRDLAIRAYDLAEPALIMAFETQCQALDNKIIEIQSFLKDGDTDSAAPLGKALYDDISAINALIVGQSDTIVDNETGHDDSGCSQSDIDSLFA